VIIPDSFSGSSSDVGLDVWLILVNATVILVLVGYLTYDCLQSKEKEEKVA
jgi:hypothetical protein